MEVNRAFLETRPLSYSSLKHFKNSPKHYVQYLQKKQAPSDAMLLGSILDAMLTQPEELKKYAVSEKFDLRTTAGKQGLQEFTKANESKSVVAPELMETATRMSESLKSFEPAMRLIEIATTKQGCHKWTDAKTGIPLIARTDFEIEEEIIADLKTSACANPNKFQRDCFTYDYPLQTGFYLEAFKAIKFAFPDYYFIVVENVEPYNVTVMPCSPDYLEFSRQQFRLWVDKFNYCLENNSFGMGYEFNSQNGGMFTMDIPAWAKNQING